MSFCKHSLRGAIAATAFALASSVFAQDYPSKPITIVLTFAFGGAHDVLVRGIAENIQARTGKTVVVETKPGGGGAVGMSFLNKADPDGYTVAMTVGGALLVAPHTTPSLGWNANSFTPVRRLVSSPNIFVGAPNFPARSFGEMIRLAKEKPESVSVAIGGAGNKVWMALLEARTGAKFLWVPVNTVPNVPVLGGHVNVAVEAPASVYNLVKDGKLRALGVGSLKPYGYMPDAELMSKTLPGFEMNFWWGIVAPGNLPKDRRDWLYREITSALNETQLRARLFTSGYDFIEETPEQFGAFLKKNNELFAKTIRDYKIQ